MAEASAASDFFGLSSHWVDTDGGERIHYHDEGSGFPIVFVHGSAVGVSAAANWWLNFPVLSKKFRCLAPDLIGYGQTSPRPDEQWGLDSWVSQIIRFVDAMKLERFILVGNSLGGRVSLEVSLARPDRVAGLITMGTVGITAPTPPPPRSLDKPWTRDDVHRSMLRMVHNPAVVSEALLDTRFQVVSAEGGAERFFRVTEARNRTVAEGMLSRESLAEMTMPTLIIHGREDHIIPLPSSIELATIIPNADLHVFANCGHWAQIERLSEFNNMTDHFASTIAATEG